MSDDGRGSDSNVSRLVVQLPSSMKNELIRAARDYDDLSTLVRHILRTWLRDRRDAVQ